MAEILAEIFVVSLLGTLVMFAAVGVFCFVYDCVTTWRKND